MREFPDLNRRRRRSKKWIWVVLVLLVVLFIARRGSIADYATTQGKAAFQSGRYQSAWSYAHEAIFLTPGSADAQDLVLSLSEKTGNCSEAEGIVKKSAHLAAEVVKCWLYQGKGTEAKKYGENWLRHSKQCPGSDCIELALTLNEDEDRYLGDDDASALYLATRDLSRAVVVKSSISARLAEISHFANNDSQTIAVAELMTEKGYGLGAQALTQAVLARQNSYPDALFTAAKADILTGDRAKARERLSQIIAADPLNSQARELLSSVQ